MELAEPIKTCLDYTVNGPSNMADISNEPLLFIYTSGLTMGRNQNKSRSFLADYHHIMRVHSALSSPSRLSDGEKYHFVLVPLSNTEHHAASKCDLGFFAAAWNIC
jgi:hypothetical protein